MKFQVGEVAYIASNIKYICQQREKDLLWSDTPEYFYKHAGKQVKIIAVERIYRDYENEELSEVYDGGKYLIETIDGQRIHGYWYDFHFIRKETIDVNIL